MDQAARVLAKLKARAAAGAATGADAAMAPADAAAIVPKPKEKQPSAFLHKMEWITALLASGESLAVRCVGVRLALYANVATGNCSPSIAAIVCDLGGSPSKSTVKRAIKRLEEAGWLGIRHVRGRGLVNQYTLLRPADVLDHEAPGGGTRIAGNLAIQYIKKIAHGFLEKGSNRMEKGSNSTLKGLMAMRHGIG